VVGELVDAEVQALEQLGQEHDVRALGGARRTSRSAFATLSARTSLIDICTAASVTAIASILRARHRRPAVARVTVRQPETDTTPAGASERDDSPTTTV
jgi:hypothetical protein